MNGNSASSTHHHHPLGSHPEFSVSPLSSEQEQEQQQQHACTALKEDDHQINGELLVGNTVSPPLPPPLDSTATTTTTTTTPTMARNGGTSPPVVVDGKDDGERPRRDDLTAAPLPVEQQPDAGDDDPSPPPPQQNCNNGNNNNSNSNNKMNDKLPKRSSSATALIEPSPLLTRKRPSFASVTRRQVEGLVALKFVSSLLGKEALACPSPFSPTTTTTATNHHDTHHDSNTSTTALSQPPPSNPSTSSTKPQFRKFSLVYNECSMAAIGTWVWSNNPSSVAGTNTIHNNKTKTTTMTTPHAPLPWRNKPTAAVTFRRCTLCDRYGHYEMECPTLEQDEVATIQLARELNLQTSRQEAMIRDPRSDTMATTTTTTRPVVKDSNRKDEEGVVDDEQVYDDVDDDNNHSDNVHHLVGDVCFICGTTIFLQQQPPQKTCAGCHATAHARCILPKPNRHHNSNIWYCSTCANHPDQVRIEQAMVDIEPCQGFVIEQRAKPRSSSISSVNGDVRNSTSSRRKATPKSTAAAATPTTTEEYDFSLERGWQMIVGIRETPMKKNDSRKRRRRLDDTATKTTDGTDATTTLDQEEDECMGVVVHDIGDEEEEEEVTELGEFCIKAKRGAIHKRRSVRDEFLHVPLSPGCIVAWYPPPPSTNETMNATTATATTTTPTASSPSYDPTLGVVDMVSPDQEQVLVRPVASWESIMQFADELNQQRQLLLPHQTQAQAQANDDGSWQLFAIRATAARWLPASMVHVVQSAPSEELRTKFRQDVLPRRMALERQQQVQEQRVLASATKKEEKEKQVKNIEAAAAAAKET